MAKVTYKELGLVNTREMFRKAREGGYGIPAYNFNNMEQLQAIIQGCVESRSPVILQISKGARAYANSVLLRHMARGAVDLAKSLGLMGLVLEKAKEVLRAEFPDLAASIELHLPDEKTRRVGQAVAAASLPVIK